MPTKNISEYTLPGAPGSYFSKLFPLSTGAYLFRLLLAAWLLAVLCGLSCASEPMQPVASEPAAIAFLGIWDRVTPLIERASREMNIPAQVWDKDILDADEKSATARTAGVKVLYILNFGADEVDKLKTFLQSLKAGDPTLSVIAVDNRDSHAILRGYGLLTEDPAPPRYWRPNGFSNMRRLLQYTAVTYLGASAEIEPPVMIPDYGYYLPGVESVISSLADYKKACGWDDEAPTAALLIQQSFWVTGDTEVIDAEIAVLRRNGFNVAALFGDRGKRVSDMLLELKPDIVIEDRHGTMWEDADGKSTLQQLDVPYLRPISMLGSTVDEWLSNPRGLLPRDISLFMTLQEMKGTVDPLVVGGLKHNIQGFRRHVPISERLERFASRAASWVRLKRTPSQDKRLMLIYYNTGMGKWDAMRGSPTGAFLDGPASLMAFLPRLKEAGYKIENPPASAGELMERIIEHGLNVGPWAQGQMEKQADHPETVLVPLSIYQQWFASKLSKENQQKVIDSFGPPPGNLMVVERNGQPQIVLPLIRMGNLTLAPEPLRGERQDNTLLHSRDVPPPHNYLAFYWWLQEEYKPDALLSWGTHGSIFLQPGKEVGLCSEDWSDICIGSLININLWIMDNIGEATLCRRRAYSLLVDHMVPATVTSGLSGELRKLQDDIHKFGTLEQGVLREEFRKRIAAHALDTGILKTLGIIAGDDGLANAQITEVAEHLDEVNHNTTPDSLHVLGQAPDKERLPDYLVSILGGEFKKRCAELAPSPESPAVSGQEPVPSQKERIHAAALAAIKRYVLDGQESPQELAKDVEAGRSMLKKLLAADQEIQGLLQALDGGYVPPGPGPDPVRNPSSIPAGRNLYALNPEEIPTRASWEVAKQLVEQMLKTKPRAGKVGIDLNGMNTMRDYGVMEGQILYLLGVEPVWDANGLVVSVKLIPRQELGRPRVDVFIAMGGMYKENFPTRVKLLDNAIRLVAQVDEPDNLVYSGTRDMEARLLTRGFSEEKSRLLAPARIFGTKPGNYGTNTLYLVPRTGVWEKSSEITSVYMDSMSFMYTGDIWGEKADAVYREAITGTDTLVRVWASNMTSQLSNHHAYEYLGGLSMAVKEVTGKEADAFIADVRDPRGVRMRTFAEVLDTTLRTELLSRKWISGMMENNYAGAGQISELVKNTLGWSVTREGSVDDRTWNRIYEVYMQDRYNLQLDDWFARANPHALQSITATMLEAHRKGYWNASAEQVHDLSHRLARSVVRHGLTAGMSFGGNPALGRLVRQNLQAPGEAQLLQDFDRAIQETVSKPEDEGQQVRGKALEGAKAPAEGTPEMGHPQTAQNGSWLWYAGVAAALLLLLGILKRPGSPS